MKKKCRRNHQRSNNIIGNTPYDQLGSRSNYQPAYSDRGRLENARPFTGDFDSISRQNGSVPDDLYNVLSDMPQVSNAAIDYSSVPIVTESYMDAKMNGRLPQFQASIKASQACGSYIEKNIHSSYEVRNFDGFVQDIVDKFGIERAMYTVAATIQLKLHDGRFTKEVKEAAGRYYFDSEKARLNFLTETHPVILNTLYEYLIEKRLHLQREQAVVEEKTKLPEFFNDKYLNSIFNIDRPDDFKGHSLSISDVVVANGKPYYVDTFGFKELKEFGNYAEKERKKAEERSKRSAPKNTKR